MRLRWVIAAALLFLAPPSEAWRAGLNTAFNPAQWPGATIKNLITDYGATCNGVADDTTAYKNFLTANVGSVTQVVLYIPSGSNCNIIFDSTFVTNGLRGSPDSSIPNFVMWAYGVTMDIFIGPDALPSTGSASIKLIQTVSAGSSSATTITASDAGTFVPGRWVLVGGLETQHGGDPPNFQVFEYAQINSVNASTGVVAFNSPLKHSYKSTWPTIDVKDGPASLWPLDASWDSNVTIYGLTSPSTGAQIAMRSRAVTLVGVRFNKTSSPSAMQSLLATNSYLADPEIDKVIETISFVNVSGAQLAFQNPAPTNFTMSGGHWTSSLNGIPVSSTITNTTFDLGIALGPTGTGAASTFLTSGLSVPAVQQPAMSILASDVSYSAGTFTVAKTNPNRFAVMARAVPGFKYCLNSAGTAALCNSSPKTTFTITDMREDASNYYIDTDLVGALPNVCGGGACTNYLLYSAITITQTNKPSGTPDLTVYAAP